MLKLQGPRSCGVGTLVGDHVIYAVANGGDARNGAGEAF